MFRSSVTVYTYSNKRMICRYKSLCSFSSITQSHRQLGKIASNLYRLVRAHLSEYIFLSVHYMHLAPYTRWPLAASVMRKVMKHALNRTVNLRKTRQKVWRGWSWPDTYCLSICLSYFFQLSLNVGRAISATQSIRVAKRQCCHRKASNSSCLIQLTWKNHTLHDWWPPTVQPGHFEQTWPSSPLSSSPRLARALLLAMVTRIISNFLLAQQHIGDFQSTLKRHSFIHPTNHPPTHSPRITCSFDTFR